jgi:hypothetical protein
MTAFIVPLIEGVISHAIYSLLSDEQTGRIDKQTEQKLRRIIEGDGRIADLVGRMLVSVATSIPLDAPNADRLRIYLVSPEVEAIVKQLLGCDKAKNGAIASIREQFEIGLAYALGESRESVRQIANGLFQALQQASEATLSSAVEKGVLSAHEIKSVKRHRAVLEEFAAISKKLDFLLKRTSPEVRDFLEFERRYREQVGERHKYITPPHFDAVKRVPIDDLYVSPLIAPHRPSAQAEKQRQTPISYESLLLRIRRTVLLGNPGGGKSTLSTKICHDMAVSPMVSNNNRWTRTPVLVVLRDYGAEKKQRQCSILDYIESRANATYQQKAPPGTFEYL